MAEALLPFRRLLLRLLSDRTTLLSSLRRSISLQQKTVTLHDSVLRQLMQHETSAHELAAAVKVVVCRQRRTLAELLQECSQLASQLVALLENIMRRIQQDAIGFYAGGEIFCAPTTSYALHHTAQTIVPSLEARLRHCLDNALATMDQELVTLSQRAQHLIFSSHSNRLSLASLPAELQLETELLSNTLGSFVDSHDFELAVRTSPSHSTFFYARAASQDQYHTNRFYQRLMDNFLANGSTPLSRISRRTTQ